MEYVMTRAQTHTHMGGKLVFDTFPKEGEWKFGMVQFMLSGLADANVDIVIITRHLLAFLASLAV